VSEHLGPEVEIATAPIAPGSESSHVAVPGIDGKKESEQFGLAAKQHELAVLKHELGWLGKFWGGNGAAPTNIGGLVLLLVFVFVLCSLFLPPNTELNDARKWSYALGSAALGYLFGAAANRSKG
jgi:hypothetical protein